MAFTKSVRAFCTWRKDFNHINKARDNRAVQIGKRYDATLVVRSSCTIGEHVRQTGIRIVELDDYFPRFPFLKFFFFYLRAFFVFLRENRKQPFDIIYSFYGEQEFGWFLKQCAAKAKWIVDLWDNPTLPRAKKFSFPWFVWTSLDRFLQAVLKQADIVIAGIKPYVLKKYQIPPERLIATTNGVHLEMFQPDKVGACLSSQDGRTIKMLYVGWILPERGIDTLLEAVQEMRRRNIEDFQLELVGFLEYQGADKVMPLIRQLHLEDYVYYTGELPADQVPAKLAEADICLHPFPDKITLAEIYPIKIFEYLAMSKVVIASDLPGVRSIIRDGDNGLLFQPSNPMHLADKIEEVIKNPSLRQQLEHNARSSVLQYDWAIILNKLFAEIEKRTVYE